MMLITALVLIALVLWILWRRKHISKFSDLGIPGPKPNLLFGNILELYRKGPIKCHEEWVRKYGRVVGYFYGMRPILLVADPHLLKNIFIKDFSKFTDRVSFNPLYHSSEKDNKNESVLILKGQKWKEIRSVLTPSFTTAKMKQTVTLMNGSIEMMIDILEKKCQTGEVVDFSDVFQRLTMDVISKSAFGTLLDVQTNAKSWVLRAAQLLFSTPYRHPFIFLGMSFPWLRKLSFDMRHFALWLMNKGSSPGHRLQKGLHKVLEHRKRNPVPGNRDLLQLLIETKVKINNADVDVSRLEIKSDEDYKETAEFPSKATRNLADEEIVANAFTVFLAGYETTSTALSFASYLLAKHPDIQTRLYEEINELIEKGEKIEYDTISKLPYLDKVFNESLRIYPPVYLFTNRYAAEDVHYGSLKIPKGMIVQANVHLMHHDADFWADPEIFDPERFNTKPNSDGITFLPFGVGPRNCLGMRFAQMEAKLALAHLVHKFRIFQPETRKGEIQTTLRIRTISPNYGVYLKLQKRKN